MRTVFVLLVEENPEVRNILSRVLADAGYAVVECHDSRTALSLVQGGFAPDILATETLLPGLDGWQLGEAVKQVLPNIGVIYIPAADTTRNGQAKRSFVLPKPFLPRTLQLAVRILASPL